MNIYLQRVRVPLISGPILTRTTESRKKNVKCMHQPSPPFLQAPFTPPQPFSPFLLPQLHRLFFLPAYEFMFHVIHSHRLIIVVVRPSHSPVFFLLKTVFNEILSKFSHQHIATLTDAKRRYEFHYRKCSLILSITRNHGLTPIWQKMSSLSPPLNKPVASVRIELTKFCHLKGKHATIFRVSSWEPASMHIPFRQRPVVSFGLEIVLKCAICRMGR